MMERIVGLLSVGVSPRTIVESLVMLRRFSLWLLTVAVALSLIGSPVLAATEEEVEAARKKGVQFLLDSQLDDGSWEYPGHEVGITGLCGLALIENGIPVDDPAIEKAERYVLDNYLDVKATYDIALGILLLSRVGDRDNKGAIRDLAARLIAGQNAFGGWSYSCPKVRSIYLSGGGERPDRPKGAGDNSCTQFATLGLWVASRTGVNIDDTMAQVAYRFVKDQNADGGWPYKFDGAEAQPSRSSMTFAGLFCLTVARANRIRAVQQAEADGKDPPKLPDPLERPEVEPAAATDPNNPEAQPAQPAPKPQDDDEPFVDPGSEAKTLQEDPVFSKGLAMASKYAASISPSASRYFMWSVERMGVMLGKEEFGTTDWFAKGSDALLATQGKGAGELEAIEGAWRDTREGGQYSETSFAILFLRRANLGSDITRLLEGEPLEPFQISSQESKPRFLKLEDAIKAAQDGDVIQVDSARPIDAPHIDIDKSLTLTAGPGYSPVFRYDVGFDERGRRSDPRTDPSARYLFGVKSGTLTLEGFRLQLDPPRTAGKVPWIGVSVEGGSLRMLNCSVAEGSRQGFAAVSLSAPGRVELKNCMLIGGRASVEVTASGQQQVDIDNSILFSNTGFIVKPGEGSEGLVLNLGRCAVQAEEVFDFSKVETEIDITSNGVAYMADNFGLNFLASRVGTDNRNWSGKYNLYDFKKWIGYGGSLNSRIKDAESWSAFWNDADESGDDRVVTFAGKRRHGAFTLDLNADDFEFSSTSQVYAMRRRTGINPVYVGPGYNFTLFREGFDYTAWTEAAEQLASAQ